MSSKVSKTNKTDIKKEKLPEKYIFNPESGRYVKRDSRVGKAIIKLGDVDPTTLTVEQTEMKVLHRYGW